MRERIEGKSNPASPQLMSDPSTGPRHKKGKSVPAIARQIVGSAIQRPDSDVMHNSMLPQQKSTIEFFEAEEDFE
jgi:hypothetical protein